jgi:hypothetical protein
MLVAVISDTHSKHIQVEKALAILEREAVQAVLHCGDICDEETVRLFARWPTHFVLGNNDFDQAGIGWACRETGATLHGRLAEFQLAGKRLAITHGDDLSLLRKAIHGGTFDFVFHGHTHQARWNHQGRTLVFNPGALHRARPKTFGLVDLASGQFRLVELPD